MIKKPLSLMCLLAMLAFAAVASANVTPNCEVSSSISLVMGGNTVIVSGQGFTPCHDVNIFLDDAAVPVVGGDCSFKGEFTAIFVVPTDTVLGVHVVTVDDGFGKVASSEIVVVSLQGPKGDTGEAGATGAIGPEGQKGDMGASFNATGDVFLFNGTIGAQGAGFNTTQPYTYLYNGTQGTKGDTGASGYGRKGDTGPIGETGNTGDTGQVGPQGSQGPQGPAGKDGQTTSGDFQGAVLAGLLGVIAAFSALLAVVIFKWKK